VRIFLGILLAAVLGSARGEDAAGAPPGKPSRPATWERGPSTDPTYFPIGVWLQSPRNAGRYKEIGVNLFVGLWKGPTAEQVDELERQGLQLICSQNAYARTRLDSKVIVGWMHGDEPDNAQELPGGKGYGPPVDPEKIVAGYKATRAADSLRPVLLNLGQGVAWDGWHGRGVRSRHPEDYERYLKGCDIASFDIYPVANDHADVDGKLWYVAAGVDRLRKWSGGAKPVWNCIECTRIGKKDAKPTPAQVKAEVWMSIVHGSRGLIYFCHQFQPRFSEAALLEDATLSAAVKAINQQVRELAPVINDPAPAPGISISTEPAAVSPEMEKLLGARPVAALAKTHGSAVYVFAVRMEASTVATTIQIEGRSGSFKVEVLGESRTIETRGGAFRDEFGPHAVHLYRVE